jgi:cell division protease FtsH
MDDIAVSLGGYIAEKTVFGDLTTGPSNDLQVLTALARDMVTKYGMSDKMGPVALEGEGGRALFGRGVDDKSYSEKISSEIDAEVSSIIHTAYEKAKHIIHTYRKALDAIAQKLVEVETLERAAFEDLLIANGITPKAKQDIEHQAIA